MKEFFKKIFDVILSVLSKLFGRKNDAPTETPKPPVKEPETPVFPPPTPQPEPEMPQPEPKPEPEPEIPQPKPKPEPEPEIPQPEPKPEPESPTEEERAKFNAADLTNLMAVWGTSNQRYDLNKDGIVDGADLGILLLNMEPEEKSEPQPEPKPKVEHEFFSPHHELLTDEYLHQRDRTIFNTSDMDMLLTRKLRVKKYYIYYPSGVSESEYHARKIDVSRIIQNVIECVGEDFEGIGMLDYEGEWFRALDKGVDSEENQIVTDVMIEAIHSLKKRFPKMKWGFYDLPKIPYWLPHPSPTNSHTWQSAPEELKEEKMSFHEKAYARLLKECDYMNLSRYHRYDPDVHTNDISVREYEWRRKCTDLAHRINRVNGTNLPIYAMYHKSYPVGGKAEFIDKLIQKDFMVDTLVKPHIDAGVNGFMYWDAIHYYSWTAIPTNDTAPNYFAANAFCKNFNHDYASIPWKKGTGPEEVRTMWRNKMVESHSQAVLDLIYHVHKYVRTLELQSKV